MSSLNSSKRKRSRRDSRNDAPPKKKVKTEIDEATLEKLKIQQLRAFIRNHGHTPRGSERKPLLHMARAILQEERNSLVRPISEDDDALEEVCNIFREHLAYNTDVVVKGSNFKIFVHGAILAQGSPSFCALLNLNNPNSFTKEYHFDKAVPFKSAVNFFKNFYNGLEPDVADFTVAELVGYGALIDMHFVDSAKKKFQEDLTAYLKKVRTAVYPEGFKYEAYRKLTQARRNELGTLFDLSIQNKVCHRHSLFTLLRHEFERTQNMISFDKVEYVLNLIEVHRKPVFGDNLTTWLISYASHQKFKWEKVKHYFQKPNYDSLVYLLLWVASTSGETGWRHEKRRDRCELFVDAAASYFPER